MSQEKAETVRALIRGWASRDRGLAELPRYLHPAIELDSPFSSVIGEPYRGYAGIEHWVRDIDEQFAEWSIVADDVRCLGDRVIAIGTVKARGRASDVTLEFSTATVCDFGADDRVVHIRIYADVGDALKAVGLAE
jgi:hypothetical protein